MNSRVRPNELDELYVELFTKAFNASANMMSIITISGRIIEVNQSWLKNTGYLREEVIGRTKRDINIWENKNIGEGSISNLEILYSTKEGEKRNGILSIQEIEVESEAGTIRYYIEDIIDVTRHKAMEGEMTKLNRLNQIGLMAAGICHELRNSITSVRGFIQILSGRRELYNVKEYFDIMMEEIDRSNGLISEFLSLSRHKTINLKKKNINTCISRLFPMLQAGALNDDKNVRLEISELPDICIDENEIRQLVLNLTRNALEASPLNGVVTIATYLENNEVVLQIKDDGKGIEEQVLKSIGTPFFTTKEEGTGMGMVICYRIAEHHNANITIDTGPSGTSFFVRFKGR